jgi:hypothetical protein
LRIAKPGSQKPQLGRFGTGVTGEGFIAAHKQETDFDLAVLMLFQEWIFVWMSRYLVV